jgi:hypothetical protein
VHHLCRSIQLRRQVGFPHPNHRQFHPRDQHQLQVPHLLIYLLPYLARNQAVCHRSNRLISLRVSHRSPHPQSQRLNPACLRRPRPAPLQVRLHQVMSRALRLHPTRHPNQASHQPCCLVHNRRRPPQPNQVSNPAWHRAHNQPTNQLINLVLIHRNYQQVVQVPRHRKPLRHSRRKRHRKPLRHSRRKLLLRFRVNFRRVSSVRIHAKVPKA